MHGSVILWIISDNIHIHISFKDFNVKYVLDILCVFSVTLLYKIWSFNFR